MEELKTPQNPNALFDDTGVTKPIEPASPAPVLSQEDTSSPIIFINPLPTPKVVEPEPPTSTPTPVTPPPAISVNLSHPEQNNGLPETAPKEALISMQMVSKTYGEDPLEYKNLVLKNIYLEIFDGEFVIIFGPSGSGKSTLLHVMAGLEVPTAGRILVNSQDIAQFNNDALATYHRLKMGMVFQQFNLIKSLNVWENVALPQTANGARYKDRFEKALTLLKLLHIDHYAKRHPNEISGGEQQRVAIARALINNPYFLLVDEPTGNLDSKSAEDVMDLLYDLNAQADHTIVLVTHNPNHLHYATRVVYVEDGKIIIEEKRERDKFMLKKRNNDAIKQLSAFKGENT